MQSLFFGLVAVVLWGSLATLGNRLTHVPPFYLLGVTFLLGSLPAWVRPKQMFPSWKISLWGIGGYFAYHFFLFYSFRFAPVVEANLINYLWPMLLVLMTPMFFRDAKLKWFHFFGAALSTVGCVVLLSGKGVALRPENIKGYLLALSAALAWPLYSIGKKKFGEASVFSIGGFCFGAGILCLVTHVLIEPPVSLDPRDFLSVALMGLGPMGLAFFAWDRAMSRGDSRVIGALAYVTPVLSTLGLVFFADQELVSSTLVAMVLITGGASTGLLDFLSPNKVK